ncbi:MAG: glycosyltransferase family 39 protein [Gammaproteobacteria bacterium]|nr:glycosyltransferase family 39 protein [Gammaproteobacteria bacterium]
MMLPLSAPLSSRNSFWLLLAAWAVLVVTALFTRPLLPVDETRYVGVAWEMWMRGDFLVPFKNGAPYSDKPPLLFWLMQAGWWLFGVNEIWPRLVAPLIGLGCLGLTALFARRVWPERPTAMLLAPWLLFGGLFVAGFVTLTQFDLLIVFCTLLGMLGLLRAATGLGSGWLIVGLAIGLGLLSKGPVILVHILPTALLGPLWVDRARLKGWVCWYGGTVAALLLGAAIALAWALPAAQAGGEAYRNAIFWGQTAERVVDSFAHKAPFWWYLPWLPVLLLPWSLWPPLWRAVRRMELKRSVRFLLCWAVPVLAILSAISGKQQKYLLPLFPALALLGAYALAGLEGAWQSEWRARRQWLAALVLALPAGVFALASFQELSARVPWAGGLEPLWALPFLLAALLWWLWRPATLIAAVQALALAGVATIIGVHLSVLRVAAPAYDLHAMSARIAALQAAGHKVAHVGKYHGQFHFLGRLKRPLKEISPIRKRVLAWARKHPDDYLVLYYDQWPWPLSRTQAEYTQDYRGDPDDLALWSAKKFLAAQ